MLDACARLGLDTGPILAAAKLDPVTLQDPDARIPLEQVEALWQKAYELSNDPNLALHAIEVLPFGAYRVIDFLAVECADDRRGAGQGLRLFPAHQRPSCRLPYVVGDDHVTFAHRSAVASLGHHAAVAEYTLAAVFLRTRIATNQQYPLMRVDFSQAPPAEHERARANLRVPGQIRRGRLPDW